MHKLPFVMAASMASLAIAACGATPSTTSPISATSTVSPPAAAANPPAAGPPVTTVKSTASETVAADTPRATALGTTFTVPAGWSLRVDGSVTRVTAPEGDLSLAITEGTEASAEDAVADGWKATHPGFSRKLHLATDGAGRNGWEESREFEYETSPNEKAVIVANARRAGKTWVVLTLEGALGTVEKRIAALQIVVESVRPKGYAKESFAGRAPRALDEARIKEITAFVEEGRRALEIPGVAISLVQEGRVVFEGGFGVRTLGQPAKVGPDTLFLMASNTKALTTLLLAREVDAGKFGWDTPVTTVYPQFKLGDEATTRQVLMKHLVCACTGLPRQDLEWIFQYKGVTAADELHMLGSFQPTTKFGETYQYSNLMAAAAGYVAGHVAHPEMELGAAYDRAMRDQILGPLGMTSSTFDFVRAKAADHASPHARDLAGTVRPTSPDVDLAIVPLRPAGGLWSSIRDMTKYVQLELSKGRLPNGKQLVSETAILARRTPQVVSAEKVTYGMGLETDTEWGVPVIHHGGDLVGYHSDMIWLPEQGIGAVIVTSSDDGWALRRPFLRKLLEVVFDGKAEAKDDVAVRVKEIRARIAKDRDEMVQPPAPEAVARLAKHYRNAALGDIVVSARGKECVLDFGEWKSAVASRKNDDGTTSLFTVEPGAWWAELVIGEKEGKRVLVTRDAQHEYVFDEVP